VELTLKRSASAKEVVEAREKSAAARRRNFFMEKVILVIMVTIATIAATMPLPLSDKKSP
jgi:hypothetical protein